jgi:multidrug efflux pump subunit AcrA (membrane-fusion protein)
MQKTSAYILAFLILATTSCNNGQPAKEEAAAEVKTPVSVTSVRDTVLTDYLELNATSTFLQNNYVKANANGYVQSVHAQPGQYIDQGQVLFSIQTKESIAIGNSISSLDSSFKFSGINHIKASRHGYITQLNHQLGDYVQDGEQLAVISDRNSFVFILNLPYELRPFVLNKKNVELILPDGVELPGYISSIMPTVDSAAQTQGVIIKVNTKTPIPQNVIAKVRIIKTSRNNAPTLPKSAILSDESQSGFWVMKMIDSATAVKVDIKKGMELNGRVEILDPKFLPADRILISGNYGLPDTAKVTVVHDKDL